MAWDVGGLEVIVLTDKEAVTLWRAIQGNAIDQGLYEELLGRLEEPYEELMWAVVSGNFVDGCMFWGMWQEHEDAEEWARGHCKDMDWVVVEVHTSEKE